MYFHIGVTADGKVDRNTWKSIQVIMNDTKEFADTLNNMNWGDGISEDVLQAVLSFFAPGEEVPSEGSSSRPTPTTSSPVATKYSTYTFGKKAQSSPTQGKIMLYTMLNCTF